MIGSSSCQGGSSITCIVGSTDGETVILGADSAAAHGDEIYTVLTPKIFARGPYVLGVCGSYRIAQVLRFQTEYPEPPVQELESFLVRELVPAIRSAVTAEGAEGPSNAFLGEETTILLGCQGQLWHIGCDLTVLPEVGFGAIGSGRLRAYGALHALQAAGVEPSGRRLTLALEAAAAFTANVRPPWHFITSTSSAGTAVPVSDGRAQYDSI